MARSSVRPLLVLSVALGLVASSCKNNHPPDVPAVPTGSEYCFKGSTYTFTTIATDPDGDSVAVVFDWRDSTALDSSGWVASGDTIALTHAWSDTGTFAVIVQAKDRKLLRSDWSGGFTVRVGLLTPPDAPAKPTGPAMGGQDSSYTFTTTAFHPESSAVAIRFLWGDGDTSAWSPFVASGEPVADSHAWSAPDTYAVRAQAKDSNNALSFWSEPESIIILPPDTQRLWRFHLADSALPNLTSSPAIAPDGTIYVGSNDSALYAVGADGTLKWRYLTGGNVQSAPSIAADGTIYFGSDDKRLYALNPDGSTKWSYLTNGSVQTAPAVAADGTVYAGSNDGRLYAINPNGTLKWSFAAGYSVAASPAIAPDGTIYFGAGKSLYALDPEGTPQWQCTVRGDVRSSPAIAADGTIYFGTDSRTFLDFYALNPDSTIKWSLTGDRIRSSPAIGPDGTIYFGSDDDYLYALNPDSTLKWRYLTGGNVQVGPAVAADGTVFVGSDDNYLHALYSDGTLKWRYETGGDVQSSPTIATDGTVYFTSGDGYLYAIKGTSPLADSQWPKFHRDTKNTGQLVGRWNRLRLVGSPDVTPDSSGFRIFVVNDRPADVTINWLEFFATLDSAYMRTFYINGNPGVGFPVAPGANGSGPGDTVSFEPPGVTISPDSLAELLFQDFYDDSTGVGNRVNVVGQEFRFRFSDGSNITVKP